MAKALQSVSMVSVSSILVSEAPNRAPGWEKNLTDLIESIKANGQIQPVIVAPLADKGPNGEEYELVAGQRRLEALKHLKRTTVKAVAVPAKATRKDKFSARMAENFGRSDYSPLEEATLVQYAIDEFGLNQQQISEMVGKTPGWVSQRLAALKQPDEVQTALEKGDISFTHVRELNRVKDDEQKKKLLKKAKNLDGSEFKEYVDETVSGKKPKAKPDQQKRVKESEILRPKKEMHDALKKLDKNLATVAAAGEKNKAAHLSGIIKGISWSYKLKGAKIDV